MNFEESETSNSSPAQTGDITGAGDGAAAVLSGSSASSSGGVFSWDVMDLQGTQVGTVELLQSVFGLPSKPYVLQGVVKSYQANRRQGTHATKTRSLVSGGGRKPFKQKGTGRARQGTTRAPHMRHGAVAHGPQPRNYRQGINQKTKKLSLKLALSDRVRFKKLVVVSEFALSGYSTKAVAKGLEVLLPRTHVLIVDKREDDYLYKSSRNIYGTEVVSPSLVNAEQVIAREYLMITSVALEILQQRLGGV